MNLDRLKNTLYEMIKEQQIKLGFAEETVRLYFPKESLYNMLELSKEDKEETLKTALHLLKEKVKGELGEIRITRKEDRFCIAVSSKGSRFVHEQVEESPFLVELIHLFRRHEITIDDVKQVFDDTKREYICEKQMDGEFDYLIHFKETKEDPYYYCVTFNNGHASYHRFHKSEISSIL